VTPGPVAWCPVCGDPYPAHLTACPASDCQHPQAAPLRTTPAPRPVHVPGLCWLCRGQPTVTPCTECSAGGLGRRIDAACRVPGFPALGVE
jgi:hypothetical protein